jgi:hypothetical protein
VPTPLEQTSLHLTPIRQLGARYGSWFLERGLTPKYAYMGSIKEGCGGLTEQIPFQGLDPTGQFLACPMLSVADMHGQTSLPRSSLSPNEAFWEQQSDLGRSCTNVLHGIKICISVLYSISTLLAVARPDRTCATQCLTLFSIAWFRLPRIPTEPLSLSSGWSASWDYTWPA